LGAGNQHVDGRHVFLDEGGAVVVAEGRGNAPRSRWARAPALVERQCAGAAAMSPPVVEA